MISYAIAVREKSRTIIIKFEDLSGVAPAGIELLNLWNDFRKVVKFIDENPWVRPLLDKIIEIKNRDNV